jgi:hypothetical protein
VCALARHSTPDAPWSLFEGLAGAVCFFDDLTAPERSAFPVFELARV